MPWFLPILIVNLTPALTAALLGWDVFPLLVLYWFENLIIGALTLFAILFSGFAKGPWRVPGTLFHAGFFLVHYGFFCVGHAAIMWQLFGGGDGDPAKLPAAALGWLRDDPLLAWNLLLFAALHVYLFCRDWIGGLQYVTAEPTVVMFTPYGRIFVIHAAILVGGYLASVFGQPAMAVILLALLKLGLEYAVSATGGITEQITKASAQASR